MWLRLNKDRLIHRHSIRARGSKPLLLLGEVPVEQTWNAVRVATVITRTGPLRGMIVHGSTFNSSINTL